MARRSGEMRDVDLVEAADEPDAARTTRAHLDQHAPRPSSRGTGRSTTGLRNAVVVAVAVGLATAGASALVSERRDAARLRTLADVPGVLAPVAGPLRELWSTDGWPVAGVAEVGGRLVTVVTTSAHRLEAVALDPRTGEAGWSTPLPSDAAQDAPAECVVPGAPWPPREPGAPGVGPGRSPVLVCVVADEVATTTDGVGLDSYTHAVRTRLVVVDAVTGELMDDRPVVPPMSVSSIGSDLLVGSVDARGHGRVIRADPRTGAARWTFTTAEPVPTDQFGHRRVRVRSEGDLVLADAGVVWVLSGAGQVLLKLPGEPSPFGGFARAVAGGRLLARSPVGSRSLSTELVDVATGRPRTADGYLVRPHPDDGSLPHLLLLTPGNGAGLVAQDVITGTTRWTVPGHGAGPLMVLDGRVLSVDGTRMEALDGVTGQVVWSASAPGLPHSAIVTDGQVVIAGTSSGPEDALVAFDVDDGRRVWSARADGLRHLFAADGRLFGHGRTGLVAFGTTTTAGPMAPPTASGQAVGAASSPGRTWRTYRSLMIRSTSSPGVSQTAWLKISTSTSPV